ncbi:MAG: 16S rRNA (guanine(527)-N(7))-methyltransferase RsmG [Clostridia bacterium]|nr:16S rRNA (guanine(527)-N(7))-methyltransferase RsmG [Clostridia bacterium]
MKDLLIKGASALSIPLDDKQAEQFITYMDMLIETNKSLNLTAITEPQEVITKHFLDSITACGFIPENASVIDVGCGAGFPGLPIKIARADISLTLLDSLNKRLAFIDSVLKSTDISGAKCVHARAEDGARDKLHREKYDVAVSRAVANMAVLCEYCLPYVKVGGTFLALKGPAAPEELKNAEKAIKTLGGEISEVAEVTVPFTDLLHKIVVVKKVKPCPKEFPRKAGTPSKKPIGVTAKGE